MSLTTTGPMPMAPGYSNSGGTVPTPAPDGKSQPTGQWSTEINTLFWTAGVSPVIRTSYWGSPLFDLRPELRAADGKETQAVPIWRTGNGGGGHLMVMLSGLTTGTHKGMRVRSSEFGHPTDSRRVQQITPLADNTASIAGNLLPAVVLTYFPPGSGYPIRFWRIRIFFNLYINLDVPLTLTAGFY